MKLNIATKLIGGFLIVAAITGLVGIVGLRGISNVSQSLDDIARVRTPSIVALGAINDAQMIIANCENMLLHRRILLDAAERQRWRAQIDAAWKKAEANWNIYAPLPQSAEGSEVWKKFVPEWEAWRRDHQEFVRLLDELSRTGALTNTTEDALTANPVFARLVTQGLEIDEKEFLSSQELLEQLIEINLKNAREDLARGDEIAAGSRRLAIVGVLTGIILAILIGVFLARSISAPLAETMRVLEDVAHGDLQPKQLVTARGDEIGQMARALQTTVESLRKMIADLKSSAGMVASSADEISASAVQITKGAESQSSATDQTSSTMVEMASQIDQVAKSAQNLAANVDETSSSIQEMAASIEQVARNADNLLASVEQTSTTIDQMTSSIRAVSNKVRTVDEASKDASTIAQSGASELSGVINGIGASSKDIGKIVKIIEEIADQTNLLALNAAIEAARAGDAGKGFAVVAEEVKRLAERSMSSTREISTFVDRVQKDVSQAVDLSGSVLRSIRDSVDRSSALVGEVYAATQEQNSGAEQILKTASNMQNVTRQLATAAKQQATAAREIMNGVETMNRMTQQVANATTEQKNGGDMVVKAVEQIAEVAQQNVVSTEQLSKATAGLAREAERMRGLSQQFVF